MNKTQKIKNEFDDNYNKSIQKSNVDYARLDKDTFSVILNGLNTAFNNGVLYERRRVRLMKKGGK